MNDLKIVVGNEIFDDDRSNQILTVFYIENQGECFPSIQWTDFTYSVVGMWIYTLLKNKELSNVKFDLYFMDGPFKLEVSKNESMQLSINCINVNGNQKSAVYKFTCDFFDFLSILNEAITNLNSVLKNTRINKQKFNSAIKQTQVYIEQLHDIVRNREDNKKEI